MKPHDHIADRERLSQFPQISTMIYQILVVAGAGGMPEKEGESIYHAILQRYSTMGAAAFWTLRDELIRILVTPDEQLEVPRKKAVRAGTQSMTSTNRRLKATAKRGMR